MVLAASGFYSAPARAGAGWADNTDKAGVAFKQPTYYANSPSGLQADHGPNALPTSMRDTGKALRKFVDSLPLVDGYVTSTNLLAANPVGPTGRRIPTAIKEMPTLAGTYSISYPDADFYEIAVVEYREQLHSDLPPVVKNGFLRTGGTTLRGYVQIWTPNLPASAIKTALYYPDGTAILDNTGKPVYAVGDGVHYLGPIIDSQSGVPVRIKFDNYLPKGRYDMVTKTRGGDVFLPTDLTVPGSGLGQNGAVNPAAPQPSDMYTQNRALIHLHGGDTPWISDGEPHSWITPANDSTQYKRGETTQNVPDMADPGPGSQTYFYPNNQSARMMWYHDHSYGATRINVYAGIISAFMLHDATEAAMKASGALPADDIPLIFEDKTFVPKDVGIQDAKWSTDGWGKYGDLWFPHVYETNQNPNSLDGTNPAGRWDYGPWFWPVFPAPLALPSGDFGDASGVQEAFSDTPVINGIAYPNLAVEPKAYRFHLLNASGQRYLNLGLYVAEPLSVAVANPGNNYTPATTTVSISPDANGKTPTATLTISPIGAPIVAILNGGSAYSAGTTVSFSGGSATTQATGHATRNAADGSITGVVIDSPGSGYSSVPIVSFNDPTLVHAGTGAGVLSPNLASAVATLTPGGQILVIQLNPVPGVTYNYASVPTITVHDSAAVPGTGGSFIASINTEVPMVPAVAPAVNPAYGINTYDGRPGGLPDPSAAGPDIIHIGTEGGFLAQPNVIHSTPVSYQQLRRIVTVLNVLDHGLYVGPAERADFVVDFSQFAGKTLIVYNDSPAPNPGFDTRVDYFTGNADQTGGGGADTTLPGFGPNTRTIMRIQVAATAPAAQFDPLGDGGPLATALPAAFAASQDRPTVPESWMNRAYNTNYTDNLGRIYAGSSQQPNFMFSTAGVAQTLTGFSVDSAGSSYTVAPTVNLIGGLDPANPAAVAATAHAVVDQAGKRIASIVLDTAGSGYNSAPIVTLTGGNGLGASAIAITSATTTVHVENKGIQELFEPNYGRMNATFSSELPYTSVLTQTTIPLGYIDPPTEGIADGETQFWKITHNGVDTHTVHFHLFNVQIINRVGWDGTVVALDPAEFGWKETVKMNPLEDIYVAVKPKSPKAPFGVPQSIRLLDPTQPPNVTTGFSQVDPSTGLATTIANIMHNFDWEYIWHCHILGHEENDFMRVISFNFGATVPSTVTGVKSDTATSTVSWIDPTPAGLASTYGNKQNEIGFLVRRSDTGPTGYPPLPATIPQSAAQASAKPATALPNVVAANATSWVDPVPAVATTTYQVVAFNPAGYSTASSSVGAPGAVNSLAAVSGAWDPVQAGYHVTLTWTSATPPVTGFNIVRSGGINALAVALPDVTYPLVAPGLRTFVDPQAAQNSTFTYTISGISGKLQSATTRATVNTTWAPAPALGPIIATAPVTATPVTLNWTPPTSTTFLTGYNLTRTDPAGVATLFHLEQVINPLAGTIAPPATTYIDISAANHTLYTYAVVSVNGTSIGVVPSTVSVTSGYAAAPGLSGLTTTADTPTQISLAWAALPAGTFATGVQIIRTTAGVSTTLPVPTGTANTFVDTTVAQNTSYTYAMRWVNGPNLGAQVTSAAVTTPYAPAGAITNLAAVNTSTTLVTLSWGTTGSVTSYTVARCLQTTLNANCTSNISLFAILASTTTGKYADTSVVANSTYTYQVIAHNGPVNVSAPVTLVVTDALAPSIPAFTATPVVTTGTIAVTWKSNPKTPAAGFGPTTGYVVQRSQDAGITWAAIGTTAVPLTGAIPANVTFADNTVIAGTTYMYRIDARNVIAGGAALSASSVSQTVAYVVPLAPTLTGTVYAGTAVAPTVKINFSQTAIANASAVSSYNAFRNGVPLGAVTGTVLTDSTPLIGITSVYQILAINAVGASAPLAVSAAVTVPPAQTAVSAAISTGKITVVSWSPATLGASSYPTTGFEVWAAVNGAAPVLVASPGANAVTANITSVVGNTYSFTVKTVNLLGRSPNSAAVTVVNTVPTTPAVPVLGTVVRNLPATTSTTDAVGITWTPTAAVLNAAAVTTYFVDYSTVAGFTAATTTTLTIAANGMTVGAQTTPFVTVGRGTAAATPTSTAYFRVRATSAVGTSTGPTLTVAPTQLR